MTWMRDHLPKKQALESSEILITVLNNKFPEFLEHYLGGSEPQRYGLQAHRCVDIPWRLPATTPAALWVRLFRQRLEGKL